MNWIDFCNQHEIGKEFHDVLPSKLDSYSLQLGDEWCKAPFSMRLQGNPGAGKTYFSLCLVRVFIQFQSNKNLVWKRSKDIDEGLWDCFKEQGSYTPYLRYLKDCEILMIDDFGVTKETETSMRNYYDFLNYRWEHHKPTVISTNLTDKEIVDFFGARVYSRLKDYRKIQFKEIDRRGSNEYKQRFSSSNQKAQEGP